MKAQSKLALAILSGVCVVVIALVAVYAREQALTRSSAAREAEAIAVAAASAIDPAEAVPSMGEVNAAARLNDRLTSVQLRNPRITELTVLALSPDGSEAVVISSVGVSGNRPRPKTLISLSPQASAALKTGSAIVEQTPDRVTVTTPVSGDRSRQLAVYLDYDTTGLESGAAPALATVGLGVLVTLGVALWLSRRFGARLKELRTGTKKLAAGDLGYRVEIRGRDEIAELAGAFNSMAESLETSRTGLGRAIDDLSKASAAVEARAEENKKLLQRTVEAVDDERRRLASELHDSTIQSLQSAGMLAEYAAMLIERGDTDEARRRLESLRESLNTSISDLRRLLFDLRPPALDEAGLEESIKTRLAEVSDLAGLDTSLEIDRGLEIPAELETVIYRFTQEALANVVRHAGASQVAVRIWRHGQTLRVEVKDNGKGFDADTQFGPGHFGLAGMRERAELAGGSLSVDSAVGSSHTRLELSLPLPDQDYLTHDGVEEGQSPASHSAASS